MNAPIRKELTVALSLDASRFEAVLLLLEKLLDVRPEIVQGFLSGLHPRAKLFRIHQKRRGAVSALQVRVVLEPTNRLVAFLAASGAGNV